MPRHWLAPCCCARQLQGSRQVRREMLVLVRQNWSTFYGRGAFRTQQPAHATRESILLHHFRYFRVLTRPPYSTETHRAPQTDTQQAASRPNVILRLSGRTGRCCSESRFRPNHPQMHRRCTPWPDRAANSCTSPSTAASPCIPCPT